MIFWTQQTRKKRPQAKKPISLGQESEKSENWIRNFDFLKNI